MQIKIFKNKLIRAITFCTISTLFIKNIIRHDDFSSILAIIFMTSSIIIIFGNEKMINMAGKKKYRFSFLRILFNLENVIYSVAPIKLKPYSVYILCGLFACSFIFYIGEIWLLGIFLLNIFVLKLLSFSYKS